MNFYRLSWWGIVLLAGVSQIGAAPATAPQPVQVRIDNFHYQSAQVTVSAGTSVTWTNADDVPHTVTAKGASPAFDSGPVDTDQTFTFTFQTPGTYTYYCKVHPHMTGTVVVK